MSSIQFRIKKQLPEDKDQVIYCRYSHKGSECLISTGKKVRPKDWSQEKQQVQKNLSLNNFLLEFKKKIGVLALQIEQEGFAPVADLIKERFLAEDSHSISKKLTVLLAWQSWIESKTSIAKKTRESLTASLTSFRDFLFEKKKTSLMLSGFSVLTIKDYETYLSHRYKHNTKAKKLKHLKEFLSAKKHPLASSITYKEIPIKNVFLTVDEQNLIENFDLSKNDKLERVRDLFIFQSNCGLRVSDLKRLHTSHTQDELFVITSKKNQEKITQPFTPKLKKIWLKYNGKLPKLSEVKYNKYLKELGRLVIPESTVEITLFENGEKSYQIEPKWEYLTSHIAIKTFITSRAASRMPITSIATLTGKTIAVILKNYVGKDTFAAIEDAKKYDPS